MVVGDGGAAHCSTFPRRAASMCPPSVNPEPSARSELVIRAYGTPETAGSTRAYVAGGRARITASSSKQRPWQALVQNAAREALWGPLMFSEWLAGAEAPVMPPRWPQGPLSVSAVFTLRRPSSAPKRRRVWPVNARSGDLDKLVRGVLDPLHGFVFTDDSQVVALEAVKTYPDEALDALPSPGVVIRISQVTL